MNQSNSESLGAERARCLKHTDQTWWHKLVPCTPFDRFLKLPNFCFIMQAARYASRHMSNVIKATKRCLPAQWPCTWTSVHVRAFCSTIRQVPTKLVRVQSSLFQSSTPSITEPANTNSGGFLEQIATVQIWSIHTRLHYIDPEYDIASKCNMCRFPCIGPWDCRCTADSST